MSRRAAARPAASPAPAGISREMIAKIKIAQKQLGLDDETYRAVMQRITGKTSSTSLSTTEGERLLSEFARLGFVPTSKISPKSWVRLIWVIWKDIVPLLDGGDTDAALAGFCARQTISAKNPAGISRPEWMDAAEGKKVIEGLKGWRAGLRRAARKAKGQAA